MPPLGGLASTNRHERLIRIDSTPSAEISAMCASRVASSRMSTSWKLTRKKSGGTRTLLAAAGAAPTRLARIAATATTGALQPLAMAPQGRAPPLGCQRAAEGRDLESPP
jgi:hypothetical protein